MGMVRVFRSAVFCLLIILMLSPTFSCVNSIDMRSNDSRDGGNSNSSESENPAKDSAEDSSKTSDDSSSEKQTNEEQDKKTIADKIIIDVPLINQMPEYINGCEITSLTMLLNYAGINIDKKTLAKEVNKDPTPMVKGSSGKIISWGDPNDGFVGDIEGDNGSGYSIYPKALLPLANKYLNNNSVDLTGESIDILIKYLNNKKPILVWVTTYFNIPSDFITWKKGNAVIKATFSEHCIVLTGYDDKNFFYNDPLNLGKNKTINRDTFEKVWNAMGKLALSYN